VIHSYLFIPQIIPNFYPSLADKVQAGIFASLKTILDKRVLPNLNPIFDNPKLDRELRVTVREKFKDFCTPASLDGEFLNHANISLLKIMY
jgi:integrator complex subunit 3